MDRSLARETGIFLTGSARLGSQKSLLTKQTQMIVNLVKRCAIDC